MLAIPLLNTRVFLLAIASSILLLIACCLHDWTSVIHLQTKQTEFSISMNLWQITKDRSKNMPLVEGFDSWFTSPWSSFCDVYFQKQEAYLANRNCTDGAASSAYCAGYDALCRDELPVAHMFALIAIILGISLVVLLLVVPVSVRFKVFRLSSAISVVILSCGLTSAFLWVDVMTKFGNVPVENFALFTPAVPSEKVAEYSHRICEEQGYSCWTFSWGIFFLLVALFMYLVQVFVFIYGSILIQRENWNKEIEEMRDPLLSA